MALAALMVLAVAVVAAAASREDELKRVIKHNTGFAHMTRGMNMYTLIALRSCVTFPLDERERKRRRRGCGAAAH